MSYYGHDDAAAELYFCLSILQLTDSKFQLRYIPMILYWESASFGL